MSIPEEMIMGHLNHLLASSDEGDSLHHLYVVVAPKDAVGPLGLVPEDQLALHVYAIAPSGIEPPDIPRYVGRVIERAGTDQAEQGRMALFAALSQEVWAVEPMDDEGHRLRKVGKLDEHPRAAEMTIVYGVCRDGRRWRGRRWLTGSQAGKAADIEQVVGDPYRGESQGCASERQVMLMRQLVGMAG